MIYLLHKWSKKSKLNKEKKQAKIIILSIIITLGISDFSDIVMSHFDFYKVPHILPIMFVFYFMALCYTLVKYHFLKFKISDITSEIISNVQDMIIILDTDRIIMEENNNFEKALAGTTKDFFNKKFDDQIVFDENVNKKFDELVNGKINTFNSKIIYKANPENILTDSYVSRIIDKFNDFIGILIISKENQGIKQFMKLYKISARQMDIILLSIEGLSNNELAEKLNITKRTVETHLFYVYNKLGINNKVELIKMTNKFNLG
jgi:DNA-binding CsgD family transcriptional regulator